VPKTLKDAKHIDEKNNNRMWQDAIDEERLNSRVAFEAYDGKVEDLIGYEEITGHFVFDVKLSENFR